MLRQLCFFIFVSIFYSTCNAQKLKETKTEVHIGNKSPLGESMILTVVMVCSMASILMVLIPTALYHKYCMKKDNTVMQSNEMH